MGEGTVPSLLGSAAAPPTGRRRISAKWRSRHGARAGRGRSSVPARPRSPKRRRCSLPGGGDRLLYGCRSEAQARGPVQNQPQPRSRVATQRPRGLTPAASSACVCTPRARPRVPCAWPQTRLRAPCQLSIPPSCRGALPRVHRRDPRLPAPPRLRAPSSLTPASPCSRPPCTPSPPCPHLPAPPPPRLGAPTATRFPLRAPPCLPSRGGRPPLRAPAGVFGLHQPGAPRRRGRPGGGASSAAARAARAARAPRARPALRLRRDARGRRGRQGALRTCGSRSAMARRRPGPRAS